MRALAVDVWESTTDWLRGLKTTQLQLRLRSLFIFILVIGLLERKKENVGWLARVIGLLHKC